MAFPVLVAAVSAFHPALSEKLAVDIRAASAIRDLRRAPIWQAFRLRAARSLRS
jgi:hypothetical protein